MNIRKANIADVDSIMKLIDAGRKIMRSDNNLNQWIEGYPHRETIIKDVENGNSYICMEEDMPIATFAFVKGPDETYNNIYEGEWIDDAPYHVIHRMASTPDSHGVFDSVMDYCFRHSDNIRIDTHRDNKIMRHVIEKYGFRYCGIIYLQNGDERLAYQKTLNSNIKGK